MARLPDDTALGAAGVGASGRPIATYDTTGYARGAAALGEGAVALGKGLSSAGRDVGTVAREKNAEDDKLEVARAKSDFLTKKVELDATLADETDHESLPGRYTAKLEEIRLGAAGKISKPRTRELFDLSVADDVARGRATADLTANKLWKDATLADTTERLETLRQAALKSTDPEERKRLIDTGNDLIDALAQKNIYTQDGAARTRKEWTTKYAAGAISMLAPADRVRALGGFEATLVHNESRGNPASVNQLGYAGLYQFGAPRLAAMGVYRAGAGEDLKTWSKTSGKAPGKWTGTFDIPGHPDVRTLDDFLKSPAAQRAAYQLHTAKMDEEIKQNGFDQYIGQDVGGVRITREGLQAMLHLGGVGGTKDALTGKGNPQDVNGKSVLDYARLGAQSDFVRVAGLLPEDTRVRMRNEAEAQLHRQRVDDLTDFKARVEDSQAEAARTGSATNPLQLTDFVERLGPELGAKAHADYESRLGLSRDIARVAAMDPEEQHALLQTYEPKAGTPGYAEAGKRFDTLVKAIEQSNRERDKDPAAFAIARLPAVQDAYAKFAAAAGDTTATPEVKRAAARELAAKMEMEQVRIGVPREQRRLVPKGYVDEFNRMIARPDTAGGTLNVVAAIEREAQLWGDRWPEIYREIAKDAQPVVRVIGSGVKPAAAQILAETAKISLADILKDQDAERSATVKKDVLTAFKPLAASMAGNEGGVRTFNDFRAEGEKLAAYYVMRGRTSSDAAAQAFDDLVGHKYDFSDTYRVPKDSGFTPAQVATGADAAKMKLGELGVAPARDTIGGLTPEYLKEATMRALARNGVWVTAPDESGLALIYQDQAVRRTDGKPLVLTWAQLNQLAGDPKARQAATARAAREGATGGVNP